MYAIMFFLGIVQIVFISVVLVFELRNKSSAVFLWATLLIMFGIPHLISSFTGDNTYSNESISEASLFAIVFCCVYLLFRYALGRRVALNNSQKLMYENIKEDVIKQNSSGRLLLIILLAVIAVKLAPIIKSSGGILNTSWGGVRAYGSDLSYANSNQVMTILFYSLSGVIIYLWLKKDYFCFATAIIAYLLDVIITRNRIEVLPVICALITIPTLKIKKVSLKHIILGCFAIVIVIYFVYGLWVFRHYGSLSAFIENFDLSDFMDKINNHFKTDTSNGELNYRKWFYYFLQNDNHFENFNKGHSYIRMLLVYIPTQWSFGLKPPDFAQSMGAAIGMASGESMHPTLFGECYANLNWFGVFLGAFWAVYVTIADWIIVRRDSIDSLLLFSINAVAFVIIGRGSVYNPFFFVAYGVPVILLFGYLRNHVRFGHNGRIYILRKRQSV